VFIFVNVTGVRLIGGLVENEGRVEIYDAGDWRTVCSDDFTNEDAQVLCYVLGFPRYAHTIES
jgi:hypothetical protein